MIRMLQKAIASSVYYSKDDSMRMFCGEKQDNITHIISGCKMLAQREYMSIFALTYAGFFANNIVQACSRDVTITYDRG